MPLKLNPRYVALVDATRSGVHVTSIRNVMQRLDAGEDFVLVDIREESEWAEGRIPGAIPIGKGIIEREIETSIPGLDVSIVLYCAAGYRSVLAGDALTRMGYTRVESMSGCFFAWTDAGFEVEKGGE